MTRCRTHKHARISTFESDSPFIYSRMVDLHFTILLLRCRLCLSSRVSVELCEKVKRKRRRRRFYIFLLSLDAISGLEWHLPALEAECRIADLMCKIESGYVTNWMVLRDITLKTVLGKFLETLKTLFSLV